MQNSQQMGAQQQASQFEASQFDARRPGAQSAPAPQQTTATTQATAVRFSDWAAI